MEFNGVLKSWAIEQKYIVFILSIDFYFSYILVFVISVIIINACFLFPWSSNTVIYIYITFLFPTTLNLLLLNGSSNRSSPHPESCYSASKYLSTTFFNVVCTFSFSLFLKVNLTVSKSIFSDAVASYILLNFFFNKGDFSSSSLFFLIPSTGS